MSCHFFWPVKYLLRGDRAAVAYGASDTERRSVMEKQVGAPPKFKSKEEMQEKIDAYFMECEGTLLMDKDGEVVISKSGQAVYIGRRPPTITGLALALGFRSRQSLLNYQAKKEFMDTVMRAKARVEQYTEESLFDPGKANGAKFSLANNFSAWSEKQTVDATVTARKLEDLL